MLLVVQVVLVVKEQAEQVVLDILVELEEQVKLVELGEQVILAELVELVLRLQ